LSKKNKNLGTPNVPNDHPRAESLYYRHKLVDQMFEKVVTPSGLCAHGRGEAFDYLLGEKTIPPSEKAMEAAIASLMLAKHPVFSINGNVAALVPESIVELAEILDADIEINIFYQAPGRIEAITSILKKAGAKKILGLGDVPSKALSNISSNRRIVDPRGIFSADVVLVPLEDGDRTEALIENNKKVIAIDLNPLSRTAQKADITIVDNIIRCIPKMVKIAKRMKNQESEKIKVIVNNFNQKKNLDDCLEYIINFLQNLMETPNSK